MKGENLLCISVFFTFWGDRMWGFAIGIFLIKLTPGSLRLGATYGLILSLLAIIFTPMVGGWIDHNRRLRVVQILLVVQNSLVVLCAVVIYFCMNNKSDDNVQFTLQAIIILLGSAANVASQGQQIAVGKDWLVVVCKNNKDLLANINALFRRIDLTVAILAPLAVGALMSGVSILSGIVLICAWNIFSLFFEYGFLYKVYHQTPALAVKTSHEIQAEEDCTEDIEKTNSNQVPLTETTPTTTTEEPKKKITSHLNLVQRLKSTVSGWHIYYRQDVFLAGCSLSMLYLTVIGFSAITTGYAYQEGLSELYLSICMGLGSLFGVFGTFIFPVIRKRIGLAKTGIVGFSFQLTMLMFCGVSIWLPGSPSSMFTGQVFEIKRNASSFSSASSNLLYGNSTSNITTTVAPVPVNGGGKILTSVIVLMTGIVLSRTGLWLSDLTITQLQQEYVPESERGIVGGVQQASNSILDVGQYVLTIALPLPSQFGFLILISITAIFTASLIYLLFLTRFHPVEISGESGEPSVSGQSRKNYIEI